VPDFFDGVDGMISRIAKVQADQKKNSRRAITAGLRLIESESNRHVPHEEGDFERGSRVTMDDHLLVGAVSYRDTAFPGQAAYLHENLEIKHDSGRYAKFLERAMIAKAEQIRKLLGDSVKTSMGG
jgi:hypothetical protein